MINFNPSLGPLEGLSRAETQFNQAAQQIAQAPASPEGGDVVSLSDSLVQLIQSKNNFDANTKALKVMDELTQTLMNVIG